MGHNHCHEGSCSTHHEHGECCDTQAECGSGCKCACHQEHQCFSDQLLTMADEAWMELLKEKIKQKIEKSSDKDLDQLAEMVSNFNHARWSHKMGAGKLKEEFKAKIAGFFNR